MQGIEEHHLTVWGNRLRQNIDTEAAEALHTQRLVFEQEKQNVLQQALEVWPTIPPTLHEAFQAQVHTAISSVAEREQLAQAHVRDDRQRRLEAIDQIERNHKRGRSSRVFHFNLGTKHRSKKIKRRRHRK